MFAAWLKENEKEISKQVILEYKKEIIEKFAPASVNSVIASLNSFFEFCGIPDYKVKMLKIQRQIFASRDKELSREEYERLLSTAKDRGNERLYFLMQTICSSGLRVSELRYITVEAVKNGKAEIRCKGKTRIVFLAHRLCKILKKYIQKQKIKSGPVFVTRNGKPLDRSNIWHDMKKLCKEAKIESRKVFPHNLSHLFARTFYRLRKDIVRLADVLGHSSINTTRIYTMETGEEHRSQIENLRLLIG